MKKKDQVLLSVGELSLILSISETTIKKLVKEKEIPCAYVNRRPVFNWAVVVQRLQELEGGAA
jgi:hypothetical protein